MHEPAFGRSGGAVVGPGEPVPRPVVPRSDGALGIEDYRSMLRTAEQLLDDVDRALAALDDGSYGTCARCGAAIADSALDVAPARAHCADHSEPVEGP